MTPVPLELWGYRENSLQAGLQIKVLPLSPESVPEMVDVLAGEEAPPLTELGPRQGPQAAASLELADLLEDRPVRWIDANPPNDIEMHALDLALRRAFPGETHDWLAACAVYPELSWNLTVHMGQTMGVLLPGVRASERLMQLANLPWFRTGRMPVWLRKALTSEMTADVYERVRGILNGLLMTTITPVRKNLAIEAGVDRPGNVADVDAVESRIFSLLRDPIVVDFMTRLRVQRTAVRLPRMVARLFLEGGWLRNIFSDVQLEDLAASADILRSMLDTARISALEVKSPEARDRIGVDLRIVTGFLTETGTTIVPADNFYLYIPVGRQVALLLDEPAVSLYRQRRRLVMRLSVLNAGLFLLMGGLVYRVAIDAMNQAVAVGLAAIWLAGPFLMLRALNIRPVIRRLNRFPAFYAADDTLIHLSLRFRREGVTTGPENRAAKAPTPEPATAEASDDDNVRSLADRLLDTRYVSDAVALVKKLGGNVSDRKTSGFLFTKHESVVAIFGETHVFENDYEMVQWVIAHLVPHVGGKTN
jgi:hypothetical protein